MKCGQALMLRIPDKPCEPHRLGLGEKLLCVFLDRLLFGFEVEPALVVGAKLIAGDGCDVEVVGQSAAST